MWHRYCNAVLYCQGVVTMTEETGVFRGEVYVRPTLNQDHGSLELVSGVTMKGIEEALSSKIVELEDKAVRAALIEQGWTPPKE